MSYRPIDIPPPFSGVEQGAGYEHPRPNTTRLGRNVLPRDLANHNRARIAQRPGLSKFYSTQVNGDEPIQAIHYQRTVDNSGDTDLAAAATYSDTVTRGAVGPDDLGTFTGAAGVDYDVLGSSVGNGFLGPVSPHTGWNGAAAGNGQVNGTNQIVDNQNYNSGAAAVSLCTAYLLPDAAAPSITNNFAMRLTFTTDNPIPVGEGFIGFVVNSNRTANDGSFLIGIRNPDAPFVVAAFNSTAVVGGDEWNDIYNVDPDSTTLTDKRPRVASVGAAYDSTLNDGRLAAAFNPLANNTTYVLELRKTGNRVELYINDILIVDIADITITRDGTTATPVVTTQLDYGMAFYNVGTGARAPIVGITKFEVYAVTSDNPPSNSRLSAISAGDVYTGNEDAVALGASGDNAVGMSHNLCYVAGMTPSTVAADLGKYYAYILDGSEYNRVDMQTGAVSAWAPSTGTMPAGQTDGSQLARFGYKWRERIALYGVLPNPNNIFFSRARNPNDWNYTSNPDGEEAFNLTFADPITCSRPLDNDRVVIAAQDRIGFLIGDLALGGSLEHNPKGVGCWGHWAAASDDGGNFYFVSPLGGLYVIRAGTLVPEAISSGRRDDFFDSITSDDTVRLVWSSGIDCLFIFKTPSIEPGVFDDPLPHLIWDRTTNSFWDMTMPARMGPTAHSVFVDPDGNERILIGGWDGYIREIDVDSTDDDGEDIDSAFDYTPLVSGFDRAVLGEVEIRLGEADDAATVGVVSARSARDILTNDPRVSASVTGAQRGKRIVAHVGGSSVAIRVQSAGSGTRFSVESCRAWVEQGGFLIPSETTRD